MSRTARFVPFTTVIFNTPMNSTMPFLLGILFIVVFLDKLAFKELELLDNILKLGFKKS
ncbi:hypothetical protein HanPSC8_Chr01g0004541 [Helianthus annuus]|nr:hypothetical protein HanPSC8_Chr01g0004541 [Helianthus annuus]